MTQHYEVQVFWYSAVIKLTTQALSPEEAVSDAMLELSSRYLVSADFVRSYYKVRPGNIRVKRNEKVVH